MRIGLLGGTFDPPHRGHLDLARAALAAGPLDRVLLVPARLPPHKHRPGISPPDARLALVRRLAEDDPRLAVADLELRREGPSYTIDTVRALCAASPGDAFRLIIGADLALEFGSWKEAEALLRLAPPLVAVRSGFPLPDDLVRDGPASLPEESRAILQAGRFPFPPTPMSSTAARERLARGEDAADLLTPPVLAEIRRRRLYRGE